MNISHAVENLGNIFGASDQDSDSGLSEDGGSDFEWHDWSTDDDDSESESDADALEPVDRETLTPATVVQAVPPVFWTYARDAQASSSTCCIIVADDELRTFRRCGQHTEKRSLDSLCLGWEVDGRAFNSAAHRAICHSHYCRDRDLRKELGLLATAPVTCSERHCWFCNAIMYASSSVVRCFRFGDRLVNAPADLCRGFMSADSITTAPSGAPVTYVCHMCMSAAGAHFWQPGGPRGPRQACQHDDAAERLVDVQSRRLADKASKAAALAASKAATEEAAERARAEKERQTREVERQAADAGKQLAHAIRCHMVCHTTNFYFLCPLSFKVPRPYYYCSLSNGVKVSIAVNGIHTEYIAIIHELPGAAPKRKYHTDRLCHVAG